MNVRDIIRIALILALIVMAVLVFDHVGTVQSREETTIVRDAVRQAAITCYAVEGAYPDSVEYLREHYQLAYDEDRYAVTLDAFASNLIPDIYIEDRYAEQPSAFFTETSDEDLGAEDEEITEGEEETP